MTVTLADVNERWRIVEIETLLWVEPSSLGKLLAHMKEFERGVDRGVDILREMQMAKTYVENVMDFLDSNESYSSDMYKKLTVEYEACDVEAGGGDDAGGGGVDDGAGAREEYLADNSAEVFPYGDGSEMQSDDSWFGGGV